MAALVGTGIKMMDELTLVMNQQGNFVGGFLLGTVVGGVVGGIVGVLVTSRLSQPELPEEDSRKSLDAKGNKKKQLKVSTEQSIETARRGLEDKIAQLNEAIDDVRQQLGAVNGTMGEGREDQPSTRKI